jgi:hypothetical protein
MTSLGDYCHTMRSNVRIRDDRGHLHSIQLFHVSDFEEKEGMALVGHPSFFSPTDCCTRTLYRRLCLQQVSFGFISNSTVFCRCISRIIRHIFTRQDRFCSDCTLRAHC